jgi:hypothetical protein
MGGEDATGGGDCRNSIFPLFPSHPMLCVRYDPVHALVAYGSASMRAHHAAGIAKDREVEGGHGEKGGASMRSDDRSELRWGRFGRAARQSYLALDNFRSLSLSSSVSRSISRIVDQQDYLEDHQSQDWHPDRRNPLLQPRDNNTGRPQSAIDARGDRTRSISLLIFALSASILLLQLLELEHRTVSTTPTCDRSSTSP